MYRHLHIIVEGIVGGKHTMKLLSDFIDCITYREYHI